MDQVWAGTQPVKVNYIMILKSSSESFALFLHVNKWRALNYLVASTKLINVIVAPFMVAVFDILIQVENLDSELKKKINFEN